MNSLTIKAKPSLAGREEKRDEMTRTWSMSNCVTIRRRPLLSGMYVVRTYFAPLLLPVKRRSSNCSTSLQLFSPFCPPRRSAGWNEERKKAAGLCNPARVVPLLVCPTHRQPCAAPPSRPTLHTHALLPTDISNSKLWSHDLKLSGHRPPIPFLVPVGRRGRGATFHCIGK